jgi:RimJ/RimL family protein N-acetyltransferase
MGPNIETDRLRINDLQTDDAQRLFAYRSHAAVARFQSWLPGSCEDARAFIVRNRSQPFGQNNSWYQLAVRAAGSGELLGDLGVHFVADDGYQVEIGVTIAPLHQRQEWAKLAVSALLEHLFRVLKKHRVFASVDPDNTACLALLRSIGMRQEAHFRQSLLWKGKWVDDIVFGVLGAEWTSRPASELELGR